MRYTPINSYISGNFSCKKLDGNYRMGKFQEWLKKPPNWIENQKCLETKHTKNVCVGHSTLEAVPKVCPAT